MVAIYLDINLVFLLIIIINSCKYKENTIFMIALMESEFLCQIILKKIEDPERITYKKYPAFYLGRRGLKC